MGAIGAPSARTARTARTALDAASRAAALAAMAATTRTDPLDLLVVGGGVTGAGIALDASARGLRVGLLERDDYASGASGASSRLAHGGIRYLEQGHVSLVREALRERRLLTERLAPHLTRRLDFLLPVRTRAELLYSRFGVGVYDGLARIGGGGLEGSDNGMLTRARVAELAPGLDTDRLAGAIQLSDAQIDDSRHTIAVARTAQGLGALVANGARVTSLSPEGDGVVATAEADGSELAVRARSAIVAVGAWSNDWTTGRWPLVRPSKGTHIVVPREAIALERALISRTERSVLFVLPWDDAWIIGTTDDDYPGDPSAVEPTEEEIAYLLDEANALLRTPLDRDAVIASYAGLRPLPAPGTEGAATTTVSREHQVVQLGPRIHGILGGKYTTYRVMAADAVDAVAPELGLAAPCTTEDLPLVGAGGRLPAGWDAGLAPGRAARLLARYGTEAPDVAAQAATLADPWAPLALGLERIDAVRAFTHEGARSVDDALVRRLRLSTADARAADAARAEVARAMADAARG